MNKLTPQQQELTDAVNKLAEVLRDVVPASTENEVVDGLKWSILHFMVADPIETYDVKAHGIALALGEDDDER